MSKARSMVVMAMMAVAAVVSGVHANDAWEET